jgi:SAM-dependent methyltransferase
MVGDSLKAVLRTYDGHPLSEAAIMRRLAAHVPPITEFDLAIDRNTELTDQNHIGGFQATIALAESAQISRNDTVIDLGCGLGGPARALASVYSCRVHGIDANTERIQQARNLSKLVGLDSHVSFEVGDIRTYTSGQRFSVLWAQNAWIHFAEPHLFTLAAASFLGPSARIAFEDVCLTRECTCQQEHESLARLCDAWNCRLHLPTAWEEGIRQAGFKIRAIEDERSMMISYLERISRLGKLPHHEVPAREVIGWDLGLHLTRQGLISYVRIVGFRAEDSMTTGKVAL